MCCLFPNFFLKKVKKKTTFLFHFEKQWAFFVFLDIFFHKKIGQIAFYSKANSEIKQ